LRGQRASQSQIVDAYAEHCPGAKRGRKKPVEWRELKNRRTANQKKVLLTEKKKNSKLRIGVAAGQKGAARAEEG